MSIAWAGWYDDSASGRTGRQLLIAHGPTLEVDVGYDEKFDYATKANVGMNIPESAAKNVFALIDTGASDSCIDDDLAQSLNLPLIDRADVSGVGGAHKLSVYSAHIDIPSLAVTQWGRFTGVKLQAGGQGHQVLIGRTLLAGVIMVYDGRDGSVKLAR
jgi:predicted aspartyl protease